MSSAPIRTKFYRPSLPSDLVDRPRLIDQLNRGLDRPLTLVTAPAGYGKSILVSSWLNTCERPSAWLSLDETIDDLGVFLTYFVGCDSDDFPRRAPADANAADRHQPAPDRRAGRQPDQ